MNGHSANPDVFKDDKSTSIRYPGTGRRGRSGHSGGVDIANGAELFPELQFIRYYDRCLTLSGSNLTRVVHR